MHFVVHFFVFTKCMDHYILIWSLHFCRFVALPKMGLHNSTSLAFFHFGEDNMSSFGEPFKGNVRIKGFLQRTNQTYALIEVVQSLSTSYAEEPCKTLLHHLAAQQPPLPKVFQDQQCHDAFKILVFDFLCRSLYTTIHAGWFSSRLKTSWNGELPVWKVSTSILAKPPTKQHINRKIALFSPSLHSTPGSLTGRTGNMVEWGWTVGKRGCDVVKLETLFKKSYKSWHAEYRNIPFITQFHTSQADRAKR